MLNIPLRATVFATACLFAWQALAQENKAPEDPVIARVGQTEVRLSDLEAMRSRLPPQYQQMPITRLFEPLRQQVVDSLLIANAAESSGLAKDEEVAKRLEAARRSTLREVYIDRLVEKAVTQEAIGERYEAMKMELGDAWQLRASHILVKTEQEATDIIKKTGAPNADFAALARAHSTGPSASRGGDLGFFSEGEMVQPFYEATAALQPGNVTAKPVRTQFGWHVIKLVERRRAPVPSLEDTLEQIRNDIVQAAIAAEVQKLRQATSVQNFNIDGSTERPSGIRLAPR